jgi:hypothetical protein
LLLGCVLCGRETPSVTVTRTTEPPEEAGYTATLCSHFTLHVAGDDPLLPTWGIERIQQLLGAHGVNVTESQVRQAAHESGWQIVRQVLARLCVQEGEQLRLRDGWLVNDLLAQLQLVLGKLEAGQGLPAEEQVDVAVVQAACPEAGCTAPPPLKTLPWLLRVEQVLLGQWEAVTDGRVHCIYCGSPNVARKSRQPRLKRYYDAAGQLQTVAVYRYYCHNPQCHKGTFTNLPPDLVPYSRYRTEVHFLATQMYAWGRSTYRRTAAALGVANLTVYRWVSAWGYELLPIAALFGVVKSSGVVGVDEKFVLVPKTCGERSRTNDKPAGDRRRWMYVYFAVDVYTLRQALSLPKGLSDRRPSRVHLPCFAGRRADRQGRLRPGLP